MEKEITTMRVYKEDVAKLNLVMARGEIFADRFHEMIKEMEIKENEI